VTSARETQGTSAIHQENPAFSEISNEAKFGHRHQVVDCSPPYPRGGKIGLFGGTRRGKTVPSRN